MKPKTTKSKTKQKKGDSTVKASKDKEVVKKKKRKFKINIYRAWCKSCGICAAYCPTKAITSDEIGRPSIADEDKCIGCGQCFQRCPDFCIAVFEAEDKDKSE